ncbi:site-specific integrase, partial [Rhodococcus aetherivorans]
MPSGITVRAAGDSFLDSIGSPNTRRAYGIAVDKTTATLGETRRLADVADDEIGETLETLWGSSAVNTWNARRAAVASWLAWCREHGHTAPAVPAWVKRSTPPDSTTPVHSRTAIDRLIARRDIDLREKTLWRMLYETCARTEELLQVNIEDLDLAGRCCPVKSKGAKPRTRRRGATYHEYAHELVYWDAGTARLLPRLTKGRTRGPLF